MKVNCDFLPQEYKSFLLDTRALAIAVCLAVTTVIGCIWSISSNSAEKARLTKENGKLSGEVAEVVNQLKSISYDQAAIQDLITKFQFIQKAMGATDYPYLRFYQALELSLPKSNETGLKSVQIARLTKTEGEKFTLSGRARSPSENAGSGRSEITKFEKSLHPSRSGNKQNFQDVKVLSTVNEAKTDDWSFEMQLPFLA